MSSEYRIPLTAEAQRQFGPRNYCPICTSSLLHTVNGQTVPYRIGGDDKGILITDLKYCGPGRRIKKFLWWGSCREPGQHLHQNCRVCGWSGVFLPVAGE